MADRFGITVPFDGIALPEQRALFEQLPDLGYTDVWTAESNANDAFTPLALASVWAPSLRLGTSIVPVYTRGPATLAMCAATLAAAAPGRFVLGLGTSSNVIVEKWKVMSVSIQSLCNCATQYSPVSWRCSWKTRSKVPGPVPNGAYWSTMGQATS